MSGPLRKPKQVKPGSYKPEMPKMMSMLEEERAKDAKKSISIVQGGAMPDGKKTLNFDLQYNNLEHLNFIQSFASVYTYLEISANPSLLSDTDATGHCIGCGDGNGGNHPTCKRDKAATLRCAFFFLFNTMCGNSSIRAHFDGRPTEMQRLLGGTAEDNIDSDLNVDFLLGYTGYMYRKVTDIAAFKDEIIASINIGRPVIAKVKSNNVSYEVIIGYDGDVLITPQLYSYDHSTSPPAIVPQKQAGYDDLLALYIIGEKAGRRYTLKDGLNNIRRTMENNISERTWDNYLTKLGGWDKFSSNDGLNTANPAERQARAQRLSAFTEGPTPTIMYVYNIVSFHGAFIASAIPNNHYLHQELFANPAYHRLWESIEAPCSIILEAGHKMGCFNRNNDWLTINEQDISGLSIGICETIVEVMKADKMLLDIICQAQGI